MNKSDMISWLLLDIKQTKSQIKSVKCRLLVSTEKRKLAYRRLLRQNPATSAEARTRLFKHALRNQNNDVARLETQLVRLEKAQMRNSKAVCRLRMLSNDAQISTVVSKYFKGI